jgi:phospholipid-binding lipoprotein MlaA
MNNARSIVNTATALAFFLLLAPGCANRPPAAVPDPAETATTGEKNVVAADDFDDFEDDEYGAMVVSDPLEALNRATFMLNHGIYTVILRPVRHGYEWVVPSLLRTGIHNAYENIIFPVRFVNHGLQGRFDRAGKELGRFVVDTTVGVGGLMKPAQKIPALADLPKADTGQSFSKWGIGPGPYLVLPVLGPSSGRDFFGLAGDYALNPVNWVSFVFGGAVWTLAVTSPNTVRSLPNQLDQYDAATKEAIDQYLSARTAYMQYREAVRQR